MSVCLLALAEAFEAGSNSQRTTAAVELQAAFAKAAVPTPQSAGKAKGKENSCGSKEVKGAALHCFKAVQQRLAQPGGDGATTAQLVAVGRASLAAVEALSPAAAAAQLQGWRYNFARRLVSCKAFADAQPVAWVLFQQLSKQRAAPTNASGGGGTAGAAEAANLMVGTVLTLVLCCVEGKLFDGEAVHNMVQAAESLPPWLSLLKPEEAAKHSDATYKYLYKAAVMLLERQAWQQLATVCGGMLTAAGEDAAQQQRAVAAVGKLSTHMPQQHAAAALVALAVRAGSAGLSATAAQDLLGLLCSAAQQATAPATSQQLWQAALSCAYSSQPLLQAAALLLPGLALQLPSSSADWLVAVSAAMRLVTSSIRQLDQQLAAAQPLALADLQSHLSLLSAAFLPANALRRMLAGPLASTDKIGGSREDAGQLFGSTAVAQLAASVLELLAGIVGPGSRHSCRAHDSVHSTQGHAAAVGLVAAARLRAVSMSHQAAVGCAQSQICSSGAVHWLLGWDLQAYCAGSTEPPPEACVVDPRELAWLTSAMFNIGVDLHASQQYAAAVPAIQAALAAAAVGLRALAETDAPPQEVLPRLHDFSRKCLALADAQQRAGDAAAALGSLGHSVALLLQLGFVELAAWQPLVQAFVRLQADLLLQEGQQPAVAAAGGIPGQAVAAISQPSRRGRAAASKKGAAAAGGGHASSSSSSLAAADTLLVSLLQQRVADLPEGSIAAVMEQELQRWAEAGSTAAAHSSLVVQRLLHDTYPAGEQPVEHAGVLLALHQLGLPADDGHRELQLLERAVHVLQQAPGVGAASMRARARCLLAVGLGRQLARQALQQERQRSHAAASTSAASSREQDAAAVAQLAGGDQVDALAWQRVGQEAQQAVKALQAAGHSAAGSTLLAFEELSWLLGLHGSDETAHQPHLLLPGSISATTVLANCLFPAADGSADELQQQAEAAASEGSRSSSTTVQRAALHQQAAEAFASAGDMVPALYHAAEAHRLLAVLFHDEDAPAPGSQTSSSPPGGWWRLAAAYLCSLLQLGQLFEAAGLADEVLHALREGQRLAVAAGSHPMAAIFAARLADVYCKQRQLAAAEQAVSSAEQELTAVAAGSSLPVEYCRAAVQVTRAQLSVASGGSIGKADWLGCQAAVNTCKVLAATAAAAVQQQQGAAGSWCNALHATALLTAAEAALQQQDKAAAMQLASAAVAAATDGSSPCSALRNQQAAALLFLGQHAAGQAAEQQQLTVWGLGKAMRSPTSDAEAPAPKTRCRKAPARQPASRSRSKAAAAVAAMEDGGSPASGSADECVAQQQQQLWQALELSKGLLSTHRSAAALLAEACGRQGYLHLAAWLLHSSLGAAMRLQYQLVLYSRRQQLVHRQRRAAAAAAAGSIDVEAQLEELARLGSVLDAGLDWGLVLQLAGGGSGGGAPQQAGAAAPVAKGRKATAASKAPAAAADPAAALAALEQQARQQLHAWQASLPAGIAACSISVLPSSSGSSLVISRLAPAGSGGTDDERLPPLLVCLPVQQLSASLSQHPIRALRMDDDGEPGASCSSVQSVLDEMQAVLDDSGRSMRELSTETKEQQREWWRARVSLDDRLAALVKHMDASWLGPWRFLLMGDPLASTVPAGQAAAQYLLTLLEAAGQPTSQLQASGLRHAAAILAQQASSSGGGSMSAGELRQAAHQLCHAAGLVCSQDQQHELAALLAAGPPQEQQQQPGAAAALPATAADVDMPDAAPGKAKKGGKSVKFADAVSQPEQQLLREEVAVAVQPEAAAPGGRAGRGRRSAAARGRKGPAASAATDGDDELAVGGSIGGDTSPVATLGAVGSSAAAGEEPPQTVAHDGLSHAFDSLSLDEAAPGTAAAAGTAGAGTTARSGKHRSRLRMMQASTPGPGTVRKAAAGRAAGTATAPRAARELPLTVTKTAPPPAARQSSSDAAAAADTTPAGPVLLVLDGALQALPWESTPGLLRQRLYRMPSLACAAASAQRTSGSVDLASTFYALNPSGDLTATQTTFQDWFSGMRGWEGKAGCAPTATELAAALQSHQFFLYCGHGGGEQYISAAKLRSLERCSAALLMGCSSGRLRAQQHYEPVGAVLAYLLAGCPAAVANLWDVTDKDIDRFSQAVLTSWISGTGGSSSSGSAAADGSSSSGSGQAEGDMSAAVAAGRAACKLPHLVGAAPVCYGIPATVFLHAQKQ